MPPKIQDDATEALVKTKMTSGLDEKSAREVVKSQAEHDGRLAAKKKARQTAGSPE